MADHVTASPTRAPDNDSTTLSVSSCRTRRPVPAPSAARTDISRWRVDARTRRRFATFAQASSRRNATAASSNTSWRRSVAPTTESRRLSTRAPHWPLDFG
jgi:hypothetical protein